MRMRHKRAVWLGGAAAVIVLAGLLGGMLYNRRHAGQPPVAPAADRLAWREQWRDQVGAAPCGAPAWIDGGWCASFRDGTVVAWDRAGRRRWTLKQPGVRWTAPAGAADRLFLGDADGGLRALRAGDGAVVWFKSLPDTLLAHPPVVVSEPDGVRLFVVNQSDGRLLAVDAATGDLTWQSEPTGRTDGPAVVADGRILFGNCESAVHLFRMSDGARLGRIPLGSNAQMAGGLTVGGGLAFGMSRDGYLAAVAPATTTLVWKVAMGGEDYFQTPAVDPAGSFLVTGTPLGELLAIEIVDGGVRWRRKIDDRPVGSPLLVDGVVLAGIDGSLRIHQARDGALIARFDLGQPFTTPVAAGDTGAGVMIITEDGFVVVLGPY